MNDPYDEERPERWGDKVGQAWDHIEKRPGDHEVSLGSSQKSFSHKGAQDQRGDAENSDEKSNFPFFSSPSGEIDRNGRDEKAENQGESKLSDEAEEKKPAYDCWHFSMSP